MTKFTLITTDREGNSNVVLSKELELPYLPSVGNAIQMEGMLFIVKSITFIENGEIYVMVEIPVLTDVEEKTRDLILPQYYGSSN